MKRVFLVEKNDKQYWISENDFESCYDQFGRVDCVTQFNVVEPLDVTAQANGDYWD
jgi:hypothetical protein